MFPNFIVIGAAKCGTTSICDLLGQHPEVFMSDPKEPHYFGRDDPELTVENYEALFTEAEGKIAIGEGSTSYTHPDIIIQAASDIKYKIPDCRLIYLLRNPIKRLESDWKMRRYENWTDESINDAVKYQPTLVTQGMYWKNLNIYRKLFTDDQILIVFLEDLTTDPQRELERCFEHIHVDSSITINDSDKPRNAHTDYRTDGKIAENLRDMRFFRQVKKIIPDSMANIAKILLTEKPDVTPHWDPEIRNNVVERLKKDSHEILNYCDKPADFWSFR